MHRITELVCMIKEFTNSFTNILSSIWSVYVSTYSMLTGEIGWVLPLTLFTSGGWVIVTNI